MIVDPTEVIPMLDVPRHAPTFPTAKGPKAVTQRGTSTSKARPLTVLSASHGWGRVETQAWWVAVVTTVLKQLVAEENVVFDATGKLAMLDKLN